MKKKMKYSTILMLVFLTYLCSVSVDKIVKSEPKVTSLTIHFVGLGMSRKEAVKANGKIKAFSGKIGQKRTNPQSWDIPRVDFDRNREACIVAGNKLESNLNKGLRSGERTSKLENLLGSPEKKKPLGLTMEIWEYSPLGLVVHVNKQDGTIEWFTLTEEF